MSAARSDGSPKQQKEFVKKGMDVPLREGTNWYPVAMDWWFSWRTYVGYDDDNSNASSTCSNDEEKEPNSLHPGPINNTSLSAEPDSEELKPGMVEGNDFVLLPEPVFKRLKTIYNIDGPEFERTVIKQGGQATMNQVELYPLKFVVYHCSANGAPEEKPNKTYLVSRSKSISGVKTILMSHLPSTVGSTRFWMKQNSDDGEVQDMVPNSDSGEGESKVPDNAQVGEADANPAEEPPTDGGVAPMEIEDDEWELVFSGQQSTSTSKLMDVLPFGTEVTVMIEFKIDNVFPRDKILNRWRDHLKVGDMVDAIDTDKRWFAAVIVEKNDEKQEVKVHFQGWSGKWDLWVAIHSDNIQKLFTNTTRWRENLEVGSRVEYKMSTKDSQPRWYEATVVAIDGDQLSLRHGSDTQKLTVSRASEDICEMYTHIKRPAAASRTSTTTTYYSSSSSYMYGRSHTKGTPPVAGAVGLSNLGNTCFMNSMLQCISNTHELTDFFLDDRYAADINRDNPLGMGGKLATAYAKLLKDMWSGKFTVVVPADFKRTIGEYAPQFAGYQQQDSQELMSFLLDGLNEDLNRVQKKPYVETVESKGRPDELVARESWRRFLLRNDSTLVDRCYGLLKSHVKCAGCGFESITFDPYLSLSLPIPVQNQRELVATVHPLPIGSRPIRVRVELPLTANVMDFKAELIRILKDDVFTTRSPIASAEDGATDAGQSEQSESSRTAEVQSPGVGDGIFLHIGASFSTAKHRIYRTSEDRQAVQDAFRSSDEITVFQLEDNVPPKSSSTTSMSRNAPQPPLSNYKFVDVLIGRPAKKSFYAASTIELVGPPFRVSFHEDATRDEVRMKVWDYFKRFLSEDALPKYSVDNTPYELNVTGLTGTNVKSKLEAGSQKAAEAITSFDALVIVLSADADDDIDKDEFERVDQHPSLARPAAAASGGISLEQCFGKFVEREQLGAQELWYCPNCKNHLAPVKKIDIWAAPDVLIIHLKRFQYIPGAYFVHREKINELVSFPIEELDLSQFVIGPHAEGAPPVYELYAVSEHSGGLGGGHYTAAAMNPRDHKWYSFNDSHVSPTTAEGHVTPRAYVLFYRRKHGSARWAGLTPLEANLDEAATHANGTH